MEIKKKKKTYRVVKIMPYKLKEMHSQDLCCHADLLWIIMLHKINRVVKIVPYKLKEMHADLLWIIMLRKINKKFISFRKTQPRKNKQLCRTWNKKKRGETWNRSEGPCFGHTSDADCWLCFRTH